jgi:hypothetical protein
MSYLVAPFCSELEELAYDLVEGAFRQEESVSIDRLHGHLSLSFGEPRFPNIRHTWTEAFEVRSHMIRLTAGAACDDLTLS